MQLQQKIQHQIFSIPQQSSKYVRKLDGKNSKNEIVALKLAHKQNPHRAFAVGYNLPKYLSLFYGHFIRATLFRWWVWSYVDE